MNRSAFDRAITAINQIATGMEELDAAHGGLPQPMRELIDNSPLCHIDGPSVAKLSNMLIEMEVKSS